VPPSGTMGAINRFWKLGIGLRLFTMDKGGNQGA